MTYVVENSWSQPFKKSVKLRNNLMFIHWHISQNAPTMSHIVRKKVILSSTLGIEPGTPQSSEQHVTNAQLTLIG